MHLLWNCPNMNVTGLHWWSVNIGSGNGLVQLAITWANVDPDLYCHLASLGHNELINWNLYSVWEQELYRLIPNSFMVIMDNLCFFLFHCNFPGTFVFIFCSTVSHYFFYLQVDDLQEEKVKYPEIDLSDFEAVTVSTR